MSEFPPPLPQPFRVGVKHALPKGTWVTGRNGTGLQGLPDHKGHVLVLRTDATKADTAYANAGYRQQVACLDCQQPIEVPVDGEWLQERVTEEYLRDALDRLDMTIVNAKRARRRMAKEIVT